MKAFRYFEKIIKFDATFINTCAKPVILLKTLISIITTTTMRNVTRRFPY